MNTPKTETPDTFERFDAFETKLTESTVDERVADEVLFGDTATAFVEGTSVGFAAGYLARHYFRPTELGFEGDLLDTFRERHPEICRLLEELLENDDEDVEELFDPEPTEHRDNEDSNPE